MVTTMIVVPVLVYVAVLAAIGAVVFAGSAIVVGIAQALWWVAIDRPVTTPHGE